MKTKILLLPLAALVAGSLVAGCSRQKTAPVADNSSEATPDPQPLPPPPATPQPPPALPAATPAVDPFSTRRIVLIAMVGLLDDEDCDKLVLQFQLIPRDEVLDPISKPQKELIRYVKHLRTKEDFDDLEKAIGTRRNLGPEEIDAMVRAVLDPRPGPPKGTPRIPKSR